MPEARCTRRQLVVEGLVGGAVGGLLGGAEGGTVFSPSVAWASAAGETDAELLATTLETEKLVLLAYRQVLASATLRADAERLTRVLHAHELEHASALARELIARGGRVPPGPVDVAAGERALASHHVSASLARLRSERDCLRLLIDVEAVVEGAYYEAMSKLSDPGLLRLAAEVLASEAQHQTVLSGLLHPGDVVRAVPDAFVQGKQ